MESASQGRGPRLSAARREGERVTPLELFFDLVFVLAITQCTALMTHHPTWSGLVQGLLVLGVLWWAWVGYAWLTSVIDPEEGAVRLVMFVAMAAMLIAALCVPDAFGHLGLAFALAIGVFRVAHIALFMLASPDDDALRHSVLGFAVSTAVAVGPARPRLALRRSRPGGAVGAGAVARHGWCLRRGDRGLEACPRPLRRAPRPDHDHRPRRVDRGDRDRRLRRARLRDRIGGGAGGRRRGRPLVALLRRRRVDLGPAPRRSGGGKGPERTGAGLLLLHPPGPGRRHRPLRLRRRGGDRPPRRAPARRPGFRAAGWDRSLPARAWSLSATATSRA